MTDIVEIFHGNQGSVSVWFNRDIDFTRDDSSMVFSLDELRTIVRRAEAVIGEKGS